MTKAQLIAALKALAKKFQATSERCNEQRQDKRNLPEREIFLRTGMEDYENAYFDVCALIRQAESKGR